MDRVCDAGARPSTRPSSRERSGALSVSVMRGLSIEVSVIQLPGVARPGRSLHDTAAETRQHLREVLTHLPIHLYRQVRVPLVVPTARRRVFWTFAKQARLAHVGDVTVVLSRRRRNESPKHTKLLVTNLPHATAHLTVALYLRRWPVELCIKELKSVVGLGQHPAGVRGALRLRRDLGSAPQQLRA